MGAQLSTAGPTERAARAGGAGVAKSNGVGMGVGTGKRPATVATVYKAGGIKGRLEGKNVSGRGGGGDTLVCVASGVGDEEDFRFDV